MSKTGRNDPCPCGRKSWDLQHRLPHLSGKGRNAGFTYLGLLILLAIMGIVSVVALQIGAVVHRRAAEEELLNVGTEFSRALESYRRATPAGQPEEPSTLQDLLRDPRFPGVVRHLRKLYHDPITGQQEWGILRSEESKQIVGVFSLSNAEPIKIANFDLRLKDFAGKSSYQEWVFTSAQAATVSSGGQRLISPLELMGDPEANPPASSSSGSTNELAPGETSPRELMN